MQTVRDAQDRLREAGIRITTPRVVIYDFLLRNRIHPTCDEIYTALKDKNPSLSLASVYNVTERLSDENLLVRIVSPDGERHYDSVTEFHGHFFCRECGKIYDIKSCPDSLFEEIPGAVTESISLTAEGLCPKCAPSSSDKKKK